MHLDDAGEDDGEVDGAVVGERAPVRGLDGLQVPCGPQLQVVLLVLHTLRQTQMGYRVLGLEHPDNCDVTKCAFTALACGRAVAALTCRSARRP